VRDDSAAQTESAGPEKQTHHRVPQIVATITIGAIAILPRLAPKNGCERDDQRRVGGPWQFEGAHDRFSPIADAANFERVKVGAIVIVAVAHSRESSSDDVRFGGMKISGRRIHAQAVTIVRARNFFPRADSHGMPQEAAEQSGVKGDFFSAFRRATSS
jgi:hypothetical protein